MVGNFKNKNYWAIILGGSSGLGLASAIKLSKHGFNICIVHRDPRNRLDEIEKSFEKIRKADVSLLSFNSDALKMEKKDEIIGALKSALGGEGAIRALIHSIAKGNLKSMTTSGNQQLQQEDFLLTIQAMGTSLYEWTKSLHGQGLFAADARVISFTSEGNRKALKNYAAVSAAKATLEAITRNIALEFAPFGIRANCLQAGFTDTTSFRMIPESDRLKSYTLERNPFQRMTRPEDVANVVYLLSTDEAAWINGCIIPVDGGEHMC